MLQTKYSKHRLHNMRFLLYKCVLFVFQMRTHYDFKFMIVILFWQNTEYDIALLLKMIFTYYIVCGLKLMQTKV